VIYQGRDITRKSAAWRRLRGMSRSFQRTSIFPDLTVREQIALVARHLGDDSPGDIVETMDLAEYRDKKAGYIAYGVQRRVDPLPGYAAAKLGVAISPRGRRILPNLTVKENLLLGRATGRAGPWSLRAVYDLFPVLEERARSPGAMPSGGQQQMLAVGRA
jgi:ABC-type branched-subunit amino acid transport system ATPase component